MGQSGSGFELETNNSVNLTLTLFICNNILKNLILCNWLKVVVAMGGQQSGL